MNTQEQPSPTPRTDQCYHDWNTSFTRQGLLSPDELSRQLETELAAATAENARLREALEKAFKLIGTEFTFRRHSPTWKMVDGIQIHDEVRDALNPKR